jgi:hypothetical protein
MKTIALDFDGVIHRYSKGWTTPEDVYDPPTDGFKEWLEEAEKTFEIVVVSSRLSSVAGHRAVRDWLAKHGLERLRTSTDRPPAFLTIDDRALNFTGNWKDYPLDILESFQPWGIREQSDAEGPGV